MASQLSSAQTLMSVACVPGQERCSAAYHETGKDHAVRQVLPSRAQCWRPQKHKGVHAALEQGLHGAQQRNLLVCTA